MSWNTHIPKFRRFVLQNFPFIEEDFDALTDYQLICKVVEFLNTVITSQNEVISELGTFETNITNNFNLLQSSFNELKDFVDNYFENLDVQNEINNKLEAMAADGTLQEIITAYIQANVSWTFDTVADMKLATNLVDGSYAKTLGFYTINDGGGALYKITNTGEANEMDVIAVGTLSANLVYGKSINVKQVGAYGDDTHNDYTAINRAYQIASTDSVILEFPKSTYKVDEQLTLKHIVIDCKGKIDNGVTLILGANSNGSTKTSVFIAECNDVQIEGAKNSYFNIEQCKDLTVFANGSVVDSASTGYCRIDGISCASITLNGINNGWINENEFNIKRCLGDLTITGDGTYLHNNNHFENVCIEGSTHKIQIDYGHNNYIKYRGENSPSIIIGDEATKAFNNVINKQYSSVIGGTIQANEFNSVKSFNFIGNEYLPSYKTITLLDINKYNVKKFNGNLYLNNAGKIGGGYVNEIDSEKLDASYPFIIYVKCDAAAQYIYFTCYDENDNKVQGNVFGPGIAWNSTNSDYRISSPADKILLCFAPNSTVKKVHLRVQCNATITFEHCKILMYMPFVNTEYFVNTIKTDRKYYNNIPSTITSWNPTWEVGDVVYNSEPTPGGVYAWVCTTAGTGSASVWKAIEISA